MMSGGQTTREEFVRAAVLCGPVETSYRRAGVGPTVVLLLDGARLTAERLAPLISRARVIIPDTTTLMALLPSTFDGESPFVRWLRLFLEGLGVASVRIVATPAIAEELTLFVQREPEFVKRVMLLHDLPSSWDQVAAELFERQ